MRCNVCGLHAPTRYVEFYQNIGAFVMRFSKEIKGELCKRCINKTFYEFTFVTMAVGWFGMISMILTPIFIINNIVRFCGTIGMKAGDADADAGPPPAHPTLSLNRDAVARLTPFREELQTRLDNLEALDNITLSIGPRAGVSAAQVELFIEEKMTTR